jgi:hypothetical protein
MENYTMNDDARRTESLADYLTNNDLIEVKCPSLSTKRTFFESSKNADVSSLVRPFQEVVFRDGAKTAGLARQGNKPFLFFDTYGRN